MELVAATKAGIHPLDGGPVELEGLDVTHLDGDWAVTDGTTLHRRDGVGWDRVAAFSGLTLRCVTGVGEGMALVGTSDARLLRFADDGIEPLEGFDNAEGRGGWYTPWGGPPDTRSLSVGPDRALHANVHVGGILRSTDDGTTWVPTIDVDADVHQVLAHPGLAGGVLAATARGLAVSRDAGATWVFDTEGLHAGYCRAVAVAGDTVLLSASTGPFSEDAAVYRRALDETGPFERCEAGLPERFGSNVDTHLVAAVDDDAAIAHGGAVYRSTDAGAAWSVAADGLPEIRAIDFR